MPFENKFTDLTSLYKKLHFAKKVVIVDGMIGGGKNLISSIITSLPNVEMWLHKPKVEQICILCNHDHVSLDAAKTLIKIWVDEEIYNQSISRNTNFKPSDYSSVFHDSKPLSYFRRLFKSPSEGEKTLKKEMPTLNLMTHVNTSYAKPLFEALEERLIYIKIARHPMSTYMIKHNINWIKKWESNGRFGHLMYKTFDNNSKQIHIPLYAKKIEKEYLKANHADKAILLLDQWIRNGDSFIDEIKKITKAKIYEIPYEKFVFEPLKYIDEIAKSLDVKLDKATLKKMRKEKIPRTSLTDAPKNSVYSEIGWVKPKKNMSLSENFDEGRLFAANLATPKGLELLDQLAEYYEARHSIVK